MSADLLQLCGALAEVRPRSIHPGSLELRGRHQPMDIHAVERTTP